MCLPEGDRVSPEGGKRCVPEGDKGSLPEGDWLSPLGRQAVSKRET